MIIKVLSLKNLFSEITFNETQTKILIVCAYFSESAFFEIISNISTNKKL